jgi:hypothetical protein
MGEISASRDVEDAVPGHEDDAVFLGGIALELLRV